MSMKLDSKYFDSIRIAPNRAAARSRSQTVRAQMRHGSCQWPGCARPGTHPAPKGRGREGEYAYYCLDHVRDYNKRYDYFRDMSDDDFAAYQNAARLGHRPTWSLGLDKDSLRGRFRFIDPLGMADEGPLGAVRAAVEPQGGERRRRPGERRALEALDLPEDASAEEIKARFKTLVLRLHPDSNGGDRGSEDKLRDIIQAYRYLRKAGVC